jgi:recombinational DNA repair protein RecR
MYIEGFHRAVQEEIEDKIENATKYNGRIYELTGTKENDNGHGHGDIIKYLEENKLDTEQLQEVLLAFVKALRGHI